MQIFFLFFFNLLKNVFNIDQYAFQFVMGPLTFLKFENKTVPVIFHLGDSECINIFEITQ